MKTFRLPDGTRVSRVQLRTRNLARACEFYERVIGFQIVKRDRSEASLSATGDPPALLVFTEDKIYSGLTTAQAEPAMNLKPSLAELQKEHVIMELECIDRVSNCRMGKQNETGERGGLFPSALATMRWPLE